MNRERATQEWFAARRVGAEVGDRRQRVQRRRHARIVVAEGRLRDAKSFLHARLREAVVAPYPQHEHRGALQGLDEIARVGAGAASDLERPLVIAGRLVVRALVVQERGEVMGARGGFEVL